MSAKFKPTRLAELCAEFGTRHVEINSNEIGYNDTTNTGILIEMVPARLKADITVVKQCNGWDKYLIIFLAMLI